MSQKGSQYNMRPIEEAVLENHLTDYPGDWTFEQICDWLWDAEDKHWEEVGDEVGVWEYFEDWNKQFLVEHMKGIISSYDRYNKQHR